VQENDSADSVHLNRPFRVGDWLADPDSLQLRRGNTIVRLEPRVMDVLLYLAARAGEVVSREDIESAVWSGRVVSYDALTGSMQKLRRALRDDARQPCIIETVSKKGYRLLAPVSAPVTGAAEDDAVDTGYAGSKASKTRVLWAAALFAAAALLVLFLFTGERKESSQGSGDEIAARTASIAVLPFENLSNEPAQEYLADGITDDLITELAKTPGLFVIARDSTFVYKNQPVDVGAIARKLGVSYLLQGSVRRAGDQLRLNARLIDSASGGHLWAEHYNGSYSDVFSLQDEITRKIVTSLAQQLRAGDNPVGNTGGRREAVDTAAYDSFLHGRNRFFRYASKEENGKARELYREAIELDPDFAIAYAMLAWTYAFDAMNGWSDDRAASLNTALATARQAIARDEKLPVAYFVSGLVYREKGQYQKARAEAEKALHLDSNYANAYVLLATLLYYTGEPQQGLEQILKAMRLNPHHPYNYPFHLGQAYFILGRYDDAIEAFSSGLDSNPSSERLRVWLAAAYAKAGRLDDAGWEVEQVLMQNPDFSVDRIARAFPFSEPGDRENFLSGLRLAGFKSQ
jgi:TolB-like protein/DNA-binding winged helix-turn-helix (wHTH) protein/Tfp pilus assembly protein PilF